MSEVAEETGDVPEQGADEPAEADTPEQPDELEEIEGAVHPDNILPEPIAGPADEADPRIIDSQKKWTNYEKAIRSIWGEYESNLLECPLCFSSHKGLIDLNDAGSYPEEILSAITEYARGAAQRELRPDPNTRECDVCGGYGSTLTKGHVPNHTEKQCDACKGYGYIPPPIPTGNGSVELTNPTVQPGNEEPPVAEGEQDIWGSPRLLPSGAENPNYGKMPQYKVASLP